MEGPKESLSAERVLADGGWIHALARRLVGDSGLADDLVQETWIAAMRNPPSEGRPWRPWLAGILRRLVLQWRRGEGRRLHREQEAAQDEPLPSTDDLVDRIETQRVLAKTALELDEPYRTTVLLRYFEGLTSVEIARRQGVPAGTVRWRLKQGLERLRERLDDQWESRSAWCVALLPLARRGLETPILPGGEGAGAAGSAAGSAVASSGAFVPSGAVLALAGAGLAGVALVASSGLFGASGGGDEARPGAAGISIEAGAGSDDVARTTTFPDERATVDVREPGVRTAELSAPPASGPRRVMARFVDGAGAPVADVAVGALELGGLELGRSDVDGRVSFELSESIESRARRGLLALTLEALHPAHAWTVLRVPLQFSDTFYAGEQELAPGGVVEGRVLDPAGRPVGGAQVGLGAIANARELFLFDASGELLASRAVGRSPARTDAEGVFRVIGAPAGELALWAKAAGHISASLTGLELGAGASLRGIELQLDPLPPERSLRGRVLSALGRPVPGAILRFGPSGADPRSFSQARCDRYGRFELGVAIDEPLDLLARAPAGPFREARLAAVLAGGPPLDLTLDAGRWLELRLTDGELPLAGGSARLYDQHSGELLASAQTSGAAGGLAQCLRLPLPAGSFRLRVEAIGHAGRELGPYHPGTAPEQLELALEPLQRGVLRGVVTDGGELVAGARVFLVPESDEWVRFIDLRGDGLPFVQLSLLSIWDGALSSSDGGDFALSYAQAGGYRLLAHLPGRPVVELRGLQLPAPSASEHAPVELCIGEAGGITGRVRVPVGHEAAGIVVGVSRGDGLVFTQRVGPDGRYRFEGLAPGAWQVGRAPDVSLAGLCLWPSAPEPVSAALPSDCRVIAERITDWDLDLRSEPECVLRGRFLLDGVPPPADWSVSRRREGVEHPLAATHTALGPDGSFTMRVRQPGRYELAFSSGPDAETLLSLRDTVELFDGELSCEWELETGQLAGLVEPDGMGSVPALVHAFWELEGERWALGVLRVSSEGAFAGRVPYGVGQFVRPDAARASDPRMWSSLGRVEVPRDGVGLAQLR